MQHEMGLNEKPFNNMKSGAKKIELRLYDEKRAKLKLGDTIRFLKTPDKIESLDVKITGLLRYNSFEDLFKDIDYNISGPADSLSQKMESIRKIYTLEEEQEKGILAIHVEVIKKEVSI